MGFLSCVLNLKHGSGDDLCPEHVKRRRVNHHGGMNAFKSATLKQKDLSAGVAHLLGGRANHADCEAQLVRNCGRCKRCADGRGSNDVVTTRMAYAGQAIVFGADPNMQRTRAGAGTEGCGKIGDVVYHGEARLVQTYTEPGGSLLLLKTDLRVRVDAMAKADKLNADGVETFTRRIRL